MGENLGKRKGLEVRQTILCLKKQNQNQEKRSKPSLSPEQKTTKPEIKCYKFGKPGHMSFNCGKGRGKLSQGYLLCMTPLTTEQSEFPPCSVQGKINGKFAEMVVDSECSRTLVHRKYVNSLALTGDKITVLTAAGERLTVPLAKVEFDSEEGKHVELVGVLDKLPVDCLLGRSSFGKTLSRQNILDQWEENVRAADAGGQEAFVMTRRQRALEEAQLRADELIDRESSIAVKSLSKKEKKREGPEEGDLQTLFEGKIPEEKGEENSEDDTAVTEPEKENFPVNILDRNRNQLIADQKSDVTLEKIRREAFQKTPEVSDGYFFTNDLLFHRKYLSDEHNGTRYVDRIVMPESYRNEILRVGHTIPLSGHMGSKKTFDRIAAHFS